MHSAPVPAHSAASPGGAMSLADALGVLLALRTDQIVVTTMGGTRQWLRMSQHSLDLHYLPSSMGQAPGIGLGLALARPDRQVIVLNGDGCMLMNLGALVTLAAAGATNVTLVVLDNGLYEVTGGQPTAGAAARVDFAALGRAAGLPTVASFDALAERQAAARDLSAAPGPRLVCLRVASVGGDYHLPTLPPLAERLAAFAAALER